MDQIRPWLFISNYRDSQHINYLRAKSIKAILQLEGKVEHPGITSLYLPVEDFAPLKIDLLENGLAFIQEQKKLGNRILVACGAGVNRSSVFCIVALKAEEGLSLLEAFKEVKKNRPEAMPNKPLWDTLCSYYGESIPYLDMIRVRA